MSITNATRLSDFAAGIGTEGAILKIDNANQRVGIGTQLPNQMLTVAGIVSATQYIGDGSQLEGITSAGLGTAIDETEGSAGAVVYYTDDLLTVAETTTINPPASASAAYTQYRDVKLNDSVDLIIETGDDFIPDILGFGEDTTDPNAAGNGVFDEVYASIIKNKDGLGAPAFANGLTSVGVITATGGFSGNVTGNLTGDVTGNVNNSSNLILKTDNAERVRIDSTGKVGISTGNIDPSGNQLLIRAASTVGTNKGHIMLTGDGSVVGEGPQIVFSESGPGANWAGAYIGHTRQGGGSLGDLRFGTRAAAGDANTVPTERLRISNTGAIGLSGANYGTSGQVLTSQGSAAAPQWATPAGGAWSVLTSEDITTSYGQSYWESKDWDLTNYTAYRYVFNQIAVNGGNFDLSIRFYYQPYSGGSPNGSASLETGSSNYNYRYDGRRLNGNNSVDNDISGTEWRMGGTQSAETWNIDHTISSFSPPTYTNIKSVYGRTFHYRGGQLWRYEDDCCMFWHQEGYISGVRVYGNGGNFQHGRFQVLRMSRT